MLYVGACGAGTFGIFAFANWKLRDCARLKPRYAKPKHISHVCVWLCGRTCDVVYIGYERWWNKSKHYTHIKSVTNTLLDCAVRGAFLYTTRRCIGTRFDFFYVYVNHHQQSSIINHFVCAETSIYRIYTIHCIYYTYRTNEKMSSDSAFKNKIHVDAILP